jgi:hypothetical protein
VSLPCRRALLLAAWVLGCGCSATRLSGPAAPELPRLRADPTVVVLEPFFELAPTTLQAQARTVTAHDLRGMPQELTVVQQVQRKPLYAQLSALEATWVLVREEVLALRPSWRVLTPTELPSAEGEVQLVRVIVGEMELAGSNRMVKRWLTWMGVVVWPLLLVNVTPVEEVHRVHGSLTLYDADAAGLRGRLVRYPSQPDFAVDARGLTFREQPFALDVEFQEGLWAPDRGRAAVLLRGFAKRLAVAVVALVEGLPDTRP